MVTKIGKVIYQTHATATGGRDGSVKSSDDLLDLKLTATVGIGQIPAGFGIEVQLVVSLPGMDRALAQTLINKAHEVCPYSNATRGNIEVGIMLA